ncbi:fam-a protein [Plasmodium yoelii]|uniref:Fam-a protein n=1 Tax=Plasmodium yoelii TaxID=5861 RepID=A0A077W4G8_PLAYE|nr:fam-a protein [Plasmodium yoelii]
MKLSLLQKNIQNTNQKKIQNPNQQIIILQEVYEKNKHLLFNNPKEIIQAYAYMNKALKHLERHATSKNGYKLYNIYYAYHMLFYKKRYRGHTKIQKVEYIVFDLNKYNEIINEVWDPNSGNYFYPGSVKKKIVRMYTPNLVMIQQRWKKWPWSREKYFYAIAAKFKISKNKTIIVMASANIIDHNRKNKKYFENKIIENENLFQAEIDSEDDIRNGKLKKMFLNLNGYIVEKKNDHIYITYIDSVNGIHILIIYFNNC